MRNVLLAQASAPPQNRRCESLTATGVRFSSRRMRTTRNTKVYDTIFMLVCASCLLASCDAGGPASASRTEVRPAPLSEHLELMKELRPDQSDPHPIIRVSGIALRSDGVLALGDVSEGNVKTYDSSGHLLSVIGRKGEGPGEFLAPRHLQWDEDGRLHVVDTQLRRLQVFNRSGELDRSNALNELGRVNGFEIVSRDSYLFTVIQAASDDVLFLTDTNGVVRASHLSIRSIVPENAPEDPMWETVRAFLLCRRGDTAFVVSTLSDSLWTVRISDGSVTRTKLDIPGYIEPSIPTGGNGINPGPQGILQWLSGFHMPAAISASETGLYVSVVKGILNYGDPQILLRQDARGSWWAITDAPPIIAADSDRIISLEDPTGEVVTFGLYRDRP